MGDAGDNYMCHLAHIGSGSEADFVRETSGLLQLSTCRLGGEPRLGHHAQLVEDVG
jgi:hypothetical protein